jgi:hypothetical protein
MTEENSPDVEGWLKTLGVESLCQWDLLVFLYHHQTSLVGAEHLAHLLGYADELVVASLDDLDALGLVARSRVSQGARLYQFTASALPPRGEAFNQLLRLAGDRAGRLRVAKLLRDNQRFPQAGPAATRRLRDQAQRTVRARKPHSQDLKERRQPWRKAI